MSDDLLSTREAAAFLNIKEATLRTWVYFGCAPSICSWAPHPALSALDADCLAGLESHHQAPT